MPERIVHIAGIACTLIIMGNTVEKNREHTSRRSSKKQLRYAMPCTTQVA